MKKKKAAIVVALIVLAVWMGYYFARLRPNFIFWGATRLEKARLLPGDELTPDAARRGTRAITIDAPPEKVWPWLMQLGIGRAGFYSYDWLENLSLAGIHNVFTLKPEWQGRSRGDFVRSFQFWPEQPGRNGWRVDPFEEGRYFYLNPGWGPFLLEPAGEGRTRLIVRSIAAKMIPPVRFAMGLVFDLAHFAMEKRMMIAIKALAEGRPAESLIGTWAATAGFLLTAVFAAWIILKRPRKKFWILLPALYAALIAAATRDFRAALVGFTAVGLLTALFRVEGRRGWMWVLYIWIYVYLVLIYAADAYVFFGLAFLGAFAAGIPLRRAIRAPGRRPPAGLRKQPQPPRA